MLVAGESFGEVCYARKVGSLKPNADTCLKDVKGVEILIPCLEENNCQKAVGGLGGLWKLRLGILPRAG